MQANIDLEVFNESSLLLSKPEVLYVDPDDGYIVTRESADLFVDEFLDYIQDQSRWSVISGRQHSEGSLDGKGYTREKMILDSRVLARREPTSKQALRLYTSYLGIQKVSFMAEDTDLVTIWKQNCWDAQINKRIFGPLYRRKLSLRLLTDGELFFTLFPLDDSTVGVRMVDTLQIPQDSIITDPDDRDTVLVYRRVIPTRQFKQEFPGVSQTVLDSNSRRIVFYKDKDVTMEQVQDSGFVLPSNAFFAQTPDGTPIDMMHLPFDALGLRGNGLLFAVLSYLEAHNQFIQDRATIVKALTTYIREVTVDGGSKAVGDIAARLRSTLTQNGTTSGFWDRNPPDAVGSTWVQNKAIEKRETPPITGAGDAMQDNRILRQPISAGVGITEPNLTGDPSIGNLASQFAMNSMQLRNFEDYQFVWEAGLLELWQYILALEGIETDEGELSVDLPPVVPTDPAMGVPQAIAARGVKLITKQDASKAIMQMLGIEEIDKALEALQTEEDEASKATPVPPQPSTQPSDAEDTNAADEMNELFKEHGVEIEGTCPLKHQGSLLEMHGIHYCQECRMSFDPNYVRATMDRT